MAVPRCEGWWSPEAAPRFEMTPVSRPPATVEAWQISNPPIFAMGPVHSLLVQTNGGLKVDTELRVVDAEGAPIPGLFAAGNAGQGGILLMGYGHHLGWAFTSGRLAGRNAARTGAHR